MSTILFDMSELSMAAYALSLSPGMSGDALLAPLRQVGFSETQARRFSERYRVVDQYTNSENGLSVTFFERLSGNPPEQIIAVRGTEFGTDFINDVVIADVVGIGTSPDGRDLAQYQSLRWATDTWLSGNWLRPGYTVAGHSLGGYLGGVLAGDSLGRANQAYLYNAPGTIGLLGPLTQTITDRFGLSSWSAPNATEIEGSAGLSLIAGIGQDFSSNKVIPEIESQTNPFRNHSIVVLTDALAVYALYSELSPSLTEAQITTLLKSASPIAERSLESALDALRTVLQGKTVTDVDPTKFDAAAGRESLYKNLNALQASPAYRTLAGSAALRLTSAETADSLAQKAKNDFGWFLAVQELLPIAIEGGGSQLFSANPDLYGKWSADRVKRTDGSSDLEFTDTYLDDRAKMLTWLMQGNATDRGYGPITGGENWQFIDVASGKAAYALSTASAIDQANTVAGDPKRLAAMFDEEIKRNLGHRVGFGGDGADQITGGALADRLYGMSGNDVLQGMGGNDHIEGGRDDDLLIGGTGNDVLNGGQGYDTYARSAGDGDDTLIDADKQGRILINGSGIKLLIKDGDVWKTPDGKVTLAQTDGRWKLNIAGGGSLDLGTEFSEGNYGIRRLEFAPGGINLRGDLKPMDTDPDVDGDQIGYDGLGNVRVTTTEAPGRNDRLYGGTTDDTLRGLAGSDILAGGLGNDTLWADTPPATATPLIDAMTAGETGTAQSGRGDFLNGQENHDILVGSAARDFLVGGEGRDLLLGGRGNDMLWGDGIVGDPADTWEFSFTRTTFTVENADYTYDPAVGDDDALHGGAGDDMLSGLGGNDLLDGGIGDDRLFGGNGKDVLLGGEGNDYLYAQPGDTTGGDWLDGGAGQDEIIGSDMADVIIGGKGNDTIRGGKGRDTYIFNKGDGVDTIDDDDTGPEKSVLVFGEGFDPNSIKLRKGSLLLDLGDGDAIHIENFDAENPLTTQSFSSFQFADGTSLTWSELLARGFDLDGNDQDDEIVGTGVADRIDGRAGNDLIWALDGNDILTGGTGTDRLNGGLGNDTYVFNAGDSATFDGTPTGMSETLVDDGGNDTVRLAADVAPANLVAIANPDGALVIQYHAAGQLIDRLLIVGGLDGRIENWKVGAGETARNLSYSQLVGEFGSGVFRGTDAEGYLHLAGGKTNDLLLVTSSNAHISGGRGNDTIRVLGDNATILYSIGDGTDHVSTVPYGSPGTPDIPVAHVLKLSGVTAADLRLGLGPQGELLLQVGADAADAMLFSTFDPANVHAQRAFDHIEFAPSTSSGQSGITLSYDALMEKGFDITGGDQADTLAGTNVTDRIAGGAGDDLLQGGAGNDALDGGAGNDTLDGGSGADMLNGGAGADSYRLDFGIGQDTVFEVAGEASEIRLASGITFDNLKSIASGTDAVLSIRTTGDSLRLSDYAGGNWAVVQDDTGLSRSLAELLARPDPGGEASVRQVWNDAKLAAFGQVHQDMTARGWTRNAAPGGAVRYTRYDPVWLSATEQTTTYEVHHLDTGEITTSAETISSANVSLSNPWSPGSQAAKHVHIYDVRQIQAGEGATQVGYATLVSATTPRLERLSLAWGGRMYEQVTRDSGVWLKFPANGTTRWETLTNSWYQAGRVIAATPVADVPPDQYGVLSGNRMVTSIDQTTTTVSLVTEVIGTAADDVIDAGRNGGNPYVDLVDGGAGDDRLSGNGRDVLYGNDGNDQLLGTTGDQVLIGGRGNDFMDGGNGGDVYRVLNEDGVDTVSDTGRDDDVTAARYAALGISGDALRYAGRWVLWGGGDGDGFFNSRQEVMDYAAAEGYSDEDVDTWLADGSLVYYEPLPVLSPLDANDYRQLEAFYDTAIAADRVVFAAGVTAQNIRVSGNEEFGLMQLDMADGTGLRVTLATGEDAIGTGVELFEFADGTLLTMGDMADRMNADHDVDGTAGDDSLLFGNGADRVRAGAGNDMIIAGGGNDVLEGGAGDDVLVGGSGNNIFVYRPGDGNDVIDTSGAAAGDGDVLRFASGIAPADVMVSRRAGDLVLALSATDGSVTVFGWFDQGDGQARLSAVEFEDGTVWDAAELAAAAAIIRGTGENDYLVGTNDGDILHGLAGDDGISAGAGDDTLIGGAGDDNLWGGSGNDRYVFNRGDGADRIYQYDAAAGDRDTIRFGADITPTEVTAGRNGSDLTLSLPDADGSITVAGWFEPGASQARLAAVEFADGTVWDAAALAVAAVIRGTEANDYLTGTNDGEILYGLAGDDGISAGAGDDTLSGGAGDDSLWGGGGNDAYVFNRGDGADQISQYDAAQGDHDTIRFGAGIVPAEVTVGRNGSDLVLSLSGTDGSVTVAGWFYPGASQARLAGVEFADGTVWDEAALAAAAVMRGTEGNDYLAGTDDGDILGGLAGDDGISAGAGDDTLIGGAGDDVLWGGDGNDAYVFNRGDGADQIYQYDATEGDLDTIRFGADIAPAEVTVGRNGSDLTLSLPDADGSVTVAGWFYSGASQARLAGVEFADGTVWDQAALAAAAVMRGTEGNDSLAGTNDGDTLHGLAGDDVIDAGDGDDTLIGGTGDDNLWGGAGNDVYVFNRGDGADRIDQGNATEGDLDVVRFGDGIAEAEVTVVRSGADLLLLVGDSGDSLRLTDWLNTEVASVRVARVEFAPSAGSGQGGTAWTAEDLAQKVAGTAPVVLAAVASQAGTEGREFRFTVPDTVFFDADPGDSLVLSATAADGGALPDWLSFDALSGEFSGTPGATDTGQIELRIVATDSSGLSASTTFDLAIGKRFAGTSGSDTLNYSAASFVGVALIDGGLGNDAITGSAGNDIIVGGAGTDNLKGEAGDDVFLVTGTDSGHDRFEGGDGYDVIQGSADDDTIRMYQFTGTATVEHIDGNGGFDIVAGTTSSDTLDFSGTELVGIALIDGGLGNDAVTGSAGNDVIVGGAGTDNLKGDAGDDVFLVTGTDAGHDRFEGGDGYDVIQGSAGNDTIRMYQFTGTATVERIDGNGGYDIVAGTSSSDTLDFSATELVGIARIDGGLGNDAITGSAGNDVIVGGIGTDNLKGEAGDDIFLVSGTDAGHDRFEGGDGYDVIQGSAEDDTIRMYQFTGTATVERIDGNGGYDIVAGTSSSDTLDFSATELVGIALIDGGLGNDAITGSAGSDIIGGGAGTDNLKGEAGDDVFLVIGTDAGHDRFEGGDGYDIVQGSSGDDTFRMYQFTGAATVERIEGSGGYDIVAGTTSSDTLDFSATELVGIVLIDGGLGNDAITGSAGNDVIAGGVGTDNLKGEAGDDVFLVSGTYAGHDRFEGGAGFDIVQGSAGDDTIRMYQFTGAATVERIEGNGGYDIVAGTSSSDTLDFSATELVGIARIDGGLGNDAITGSAGNDVIAGGAGTDRLTGGQGSDTYRLGRGDGADTIVENDATSGATDIAEFLAGIGREQIWLRHIGNNLEAGVIGTSDKLIVQNWYLGEQYRVEEFRTADGGLLLDSQVENLVQAMAAFAPPSAGQTTLPPAYQEALAPVIAANWQ